MNPTSMEVLNSYKKIEAKDINFFLTFLKPHQILQNRDSLLEYSKDYTGEFFLDIAEIILIPENSLEISKILRYCNDKKIPVTTRAAGTSLSGATVPIYNGIILSLEKLNKILEIDTDNLQAIIEPGVINEAFANECQKLGLYYPPDPASRGSSTMGGNVAHNSGGPRAVKYGVTREYILNLEIVLVDGSIIWTGANTLKFSSAYNLTQLMIGSEGTLGVITKIVVKLIPNIKHKLLLKANFDLLENACCAVSEVFKKGITPSAMEFMERDAILFTKEYLNSAEIIPEWLTAMLIIEVDGNFQDGLMEDVEKINEVLESFGCKEVLFASTQLEMDKLWELRRKVGEAIRAKSIFKEEDCVVPRFALPELIGFVKELGKEYGFQSVCFGHAGDGNVHINILKTGLSEDFWEFGIKEPIRKLFQKTIELKGAISGEHGIGLVQKEFMNIQFSPVHFEIFKGIKSTFDPNNILNPGKMF